MEADEPVRLLRQKRMDAKSQEAPAAASGMGVRTALTWGRDPFPSQTKAKRDWRTRADLVAGVWEDVIEPLLRRDTDRVPQMPAILELLEQPHAG